MLLSAWHRQAFLHLRYLLGLPFPVTAYQQEQLRQPLALDSLERLEVAVALEQLYGVQFPDPEIATWQTVGDLLASLEYHAAPTHRASASR